MVIKKCPACNSTKVIKQIIDGVIQISCSKCGYINKDNLNKQEEKWHLQ